MSAAFTTRPLSQAGLSTLWDSWLTLTSKRTWNPHDLKPCQRASTITQHIISKVIAHNIQALRTGLNPAHLRVCKQLEVDTATTGDRNGDWLLAGVSAALTDAKLLQLVSNVTVNAATVGMQNRHSDTSPESLAQKWHI